MGGSPWRARRNWCVLCLAALGAAAASTGRLPAAEGVARETEPAAEQADSNPLIEKLEAAVGSPINVYLRAGQSFLRATLIRVNVDSKREKITSIGIQEAGGGKPRVLSFVAIRSITLDREKVYDAPIVKPRTAAERRVQQLLEQAAKERAEWVARATENGVKPWPVLSAEEHEAAIEESRKLIEKVGKAIPGMQLYETQEFLFYSNIPANQVAPYIKSLDAMHDMMCKMYDIKPGEPVWKGKCLVFAFLSQEEFARFERTFLNNDQSVEGVYGLCHSYSDGRVIISCYRGDKPDSFAHMLVHETSHGFIHRYRTPTRIPSWINEGMADCIGQMLVPASGSVPNKQQRALAQLAQTRSMGGDFLTRDSNIEMWQYGIASSLTTFLIKNDKKAYTRFIQGIKEGLTWQESLKQAYKRTPEELVKAYGAAIGIPDLMP